MRPVHRPILLLFLVGYRIGSTPLTHRRCRPDDQKRLLSGGTAKQQCRATRRVTARAKGGGEAHYKSSTHQRGDDFPLFPSYRGAPTTFLANERGLPDAPIFLRDVVRRTHNSVAASFLLHGPKSASARQALSLSHSFA